MNAYQDTKTGHVIAAETLQNLTKQARICREHIDRLEAGQNVNRAGVIADLNTLLDLSKSVRDAIRSEDILASWSTKEELAALVSRLDEAATKRRRYLDLAQYLATGTIAHRREKTRLERLAERDAAVAELIKISEMSTPPQLPGPEVGEWLAWACSLEDEDDAADLQNLKNNFPHLDDFVRQLEIEWWRNGSGSANGEVVEPVPAKSRSNGHSNGLASKAPTNDHLSNVGPALNVDAGDALTKTIPLVKELPVVKEAAPAPVGAAPAPAVKEAAPAPAAEEETAPVVKEAAPVVEEASSIAEDPVLEVKEPTPAVKEMESLVEEPAVAAKETTPLVNEIVPVVDEVASVVDQIILVEPEAPRKVKDPVQELIDAALAKHEPPSFIFDDIEPKRDASPGLDVEVASEPREVNFTETFYTPVASVEDESGKLSFFGAGQVENFKRCLEAAKKKKSKANRNLRALVAASNWLVPHDQNPVMHPVCGIRAVAGYKGGSDEPVAPLDAEKIIDGTEGLPLLVGGADLLRWALSQPTENGFNGIAALRRFSMRQMKEWFGELFHIELSDQQFQDIIMLTSGIPLLVGEMHRLIIPAHDEPPTWLGHARWIEIKSSFGYRLAALAQELRSGPSAVRLKQREISVLKMVVLASDDSTPENMGEHLSETWHSYNRPELNSLTSADELVIALLQDLGLLAIRQGSKPGSIGSIMPLESGDALRQFVRYL